MSIILVNRNPKAGYSIYRCFAEFKNYINVKELFLPEYRISIKNIIRNINYIKKNTNKDDIIHVTGDVHYVLLGLKHRNTVLTIHDTVLLDNRKRKDLKWLLYYFLWFYLPCKIAKKVVCISEETDRRLKGYVKCKTVVIPDPVSSSFTRFVKVFNYDCPRILHIGTGWNKNLDNVIKALSGMNVNLVIVGNISNTIEKLLKTSNISFEVKIELSDSEIIEEYNKCDIVSFPSIYEGFGLPILEGQTVGRIVVTSTIEPHATVAGKNGAIFVNPNDIESLKKGFLSAIQNKSIREDIIQNGYANIKKYSIGSIVDCYKNIYAEVDK